MREDSERKIIRSSFILERLAVILVLYFSIEQKDNEKSYVYLKNLVTLIYQNYLIFGHLISLKIKDKSKTNVWIDQLTDILKNDPSTNFSKLENLDKISHNNSTLTAIMKKMLISIHNKELLYGFNSIILQLNKIKLKEAYHRLLKSFTVFISEKELKSHQVF